MVVNPSALKTLIAQGQGQGLKLAPQEETGDFTLNVLLLNNFSNPDNKVSGFFLQHRRHDCDWNTVAWKPITFEMQSYREK